MFKQPPPDTHKPPDLPCEDNPKKHEIKSTDAWAKEEIIDVRFIFEPVNIAIILIQSFLADQKLSLMKIFELFV